MVRHRTGDEFLTLIKLITKFSLTAAESTVSHEIVRVTWALSATCSPLLGAQLPVVKDNPGTMQSGDLGRRAPGKELCENKPWEEGLSSLAWELCELPGSCLSNVVGMLFPGRDLTDLDLLTRFSGLTFNLPSHYRFAWQSPDRQLNLVAVTCPDSDPDTLTSFQITSHHFALVLWSGLPGDPNYHNQTHPACFAQLPWGCALVSEDIAPDRLAVTINSQMAFPCGAAYSCCSLTYRISLPFISRLFFLFCLLPIFDTIDHSCLPGILHPRGLKITFFPSSSFQDCYFSSSFGEPFHSFPALSSFPRAVSIAFCSSYIMFSLQAISSAGSYSVITSLLMTNKSSSASLIVLLVIFPICPSLKLCHFKVLSALNKLATKS